MRSKPPLPLSPDQRRAAKAIFEKIRTARNLDKVDGGQIAQLLRDFMKVLNLTPQLVMDRCQVASSTLYRWLAGEKPPLHRLEMLSGFFDEAVVMVSDSIVSGDRRLTLRTTNQVLERQIRCKRCWVIKNSLPYHAATPGIVMDALFEFIGRMGQEDAFHCIFYAPKEKFEGPISPYAGLESFREFKYRFFRFLQGKGNLEPLSKLHGWCVTSDSLAYVLGLTDHYIGVNILEYDYQKTLDSPHLATRNVDILIEIPLAIYPPDSDQKVRGDEESRWVELAPRKAESYWEEKKTFLSSLPAYAVSHSAEVREIMNTVGEFENYERRAYR